MPRQATRRRPKLAETRRRSRRTLSPIRPDLASWGGSGDAVEIGWSTLSFTLILLAALVLAGCGSGSKGGVSSSAFTSSEMDDPLGPKDARFLSFAAVEVAGTRLTRSRPNTALRTVTQTSEPDSVSTEFVGGSRVKVVVDREGGNVFTLDSAIHSAKETVVDATAQQEYFISPEDRFPIPSSLAPGYEYRRWTLFDYSENTASLAYVSINWNSTDPFDYLAGGTWMHLEGNLQSGSPVSVASVGAFVDGPEFSSAPTLPASGTADFRGRASGLYTYYYGPGGQEQFGELFPAAGSEESGILAGVATLTVDFGRSTISGCIGCHEGGDNPNSVLFETIGDIAFPNGIRHALYGGYLDIDPPDTTTTPPAGSYARIFLGEATIDPATATFSSSNIRYELDYFPEGETEGYWGGRFSNVLEQDTPRLVGGTLGAQWSDPAGGRATFILHFIAPRQSSTP